MDQKQVTTLVSALCLMCMPGVLADDCSAYMDSNFQFHRPQTCVLSFCAGSCTNRYCSIIPGTALDQTQFMCILNNLYFIIGSGIVISLIVVVGVIACCCKSLCMCCRLCTPPPRMTTRTNMIVTNVIPQQPLVQIPYSSAPPGYQPVPSQNVYSPPPYPGEPRGYSSYPTK